MGRRDGWYVFSSRGIVLSYIAADPGCTITEVAEAIALTPRTVRGLIGDLSRAGMLHVSREGRRHHYTVNLDAPFLHPTLTGSTLRPVLGGIAEQARQRTRASSTQLAETTPRAASR